MIKTCIGCSKRYSTRDKRRKYCSVSCGLSHAKIERILTCVMCKKKFKFVGRTKAKYCPTCRKKQNVINTQKCQLKRNPDKKIGVGSGGNQFGSNNHQWKKDRAAVATQYRTNYRLRCFKIWDTQCVINDGECDGHIEVHHIDGDNTNFDSSNLIPLCFHHHWIVHGKRCRGNELVERLETIWPNCRIKIAEKIGNPEMGIRPEGCE